MPHYGLLALFETHKAIRWEQVFVVGRSATLAVIVLSRGGVWHLVVGLLAMTAVEAVSADYRLLRLIRHEQPAAPPGSLGKAQVFGLLTVLDKACAGVGSGPMLLLVLRRFTRSAWCCLAPALT